MNALITQLLAAEKQEGGLASLLPLILIVVGAGYFMMGPQRKQKKQQAEMLSKLAVGDDVVTSGGILGTVTFLEDQIAHIQVDTDVVIRVSKSSLTRRESARDDSEDEPASESTDEKSSGSTADDGESSGGAIVPRRFGSRGKASKPSPS